MLPQVRGFMTNWVVRLWTAARHAKDLADWIVILGWIGVPGVTGAIALFKGQEWDVILLYVLAGLAFWSVIRGELRVILADRIGLDVDTNLTADGEMDLFRLRVRNAGDQVTPRAALMWIEADGHPDHAETTPVDLCWMHMRPGTQPEMSWDDVASVDVVYVTDRGRVTERLIFAGAGFQPHVSLRPLQAKYRDVAFCIRLAIPGTRKFYERAFTLEPDPVRPLGLRPVRLANRENSHGGTPLRPRA